MGDIEQFCAPKLRKTQLTAAASHKVPEFRSLMAIRQLDSDLRRNQLTAFLTRIVLTAVL
jgi:hypothetical protein